MSLLSTQVIPTVQRPPNGEKVQKGLEYESRLKLFTEPYQASEVRHLSAWTELMNCLASTLTPDKFNAITKYFTFPLSIVNISNDMLTDLYKVFDGRNSNFNIEYPNSRIEETAEAVLSDLGIRKFIENVGKKVLKSCPNLVVVLDKNDKGDPIILAIPNERIHGYTQNKDGSFDVFMFIHSVGMENGKHWTKYGVYDDEFYRVVKRVEGVYTLDTEESHDLGYCPAKFFYDTPLTSDKFQFNRGVPLSNVVGVMSQWQQFDVFKYYADHIYPFPVTEYPDSGCDDDRCINGTVYYEPILDDNNKVVSQKNPTECPSCAKKHLIGPGTSLGIEVSQDSADQDTRGVFRFISPDVVGLEYIGTKQMERESFIKLNVVGYNNESTSSAVNELQIMSSLESRKKPLLDIKEHLDDLYRWIAKGVVKLTYNVDVRVHANFGTEYFILGEKDILNIIQQAKLAGVQDTEIEQLNRLLIETKYKGNPYTIQKMLITSDVEPSPFDTRLEARAKFSEGMMTREDYYMKVNFSDLIGRFERENGSIIDFGEALSYAKKIEKIKAELLIYTNEKLESNGTSDNSTQPSRVSDQGASQS